jgi:hypothetical protein
VNAADKMDEKLCGHLVLVHARYFVANVSLFGAGDVGHIMDGRLTEAQILDPLHEIGKHAPLAGRYVISRFSRYDQSLDAVWG